MLIKLKKKIIKYIIKNKIKYETYNGNSAFMIDHYYYKLLHISYFPIKNAMN